MKPKSGDYFIVEKEKCIHWRHDKHNYRKRKDRATQAVENKMYLQVNLKKVMV